MSRRPRIHFPNAFYHVIARGNQRQGIFLDEKDYQRYLSYLSEYKTRYLFHLYAYALMKNHVHLLLEVEATYFHREPAMISQGVMKVENLLRADEGLVEKVERIERKMIRNRRKKYLTTNA